MKKAFTLVELLVYMAIMGFIIVVAGRVFSDSTSMRVRTQNMTKATEEVNKIAELLKEDLSQMGAKVWKDDAASTAEGDVFSVSEDVYWNNATDSSSFSLEHRNFFENGNDAIAFRKIAFDDDGDVEVRQIIWQLDENGNLLRSESASISAGLDPDADANSIVMATDVQAFYLLPSHPGMAADDALSFGGYPKYGTPTFGLRDLAPDSDCGSNGDCQAIGVLELTSGTNTFLLSSFAFNEEEGSGAKQNKICVSGPSGDGCEDFVFEKGETYFAQFATPTGATSQDTAMSLFQPGIDHASIGFRRKSDGSLISDFIFYAPQLASEGGNRKQYFEFSVPEQEMAQAVFTFAFYSPRANMGNLRIQDFEIGQKNEAYRFVRLGDDNYNENYATIKDGNLQNKKNVKAFELLLEINKKGEIGSVNRYVIPVPNNGIAP